MSHLDRAAPAASAATVDQVFREEYGRAVATLIRLVGDIGVAEEVVQEAFEVALRRWPVEGVPPSPAGWIITTARRRSIDRHRRESVRMPRSIAAALAQSLREEIEEVAEPMPDDQLRLLFTCCHPALSHPAQVALSLRLVGGLTTREIARAFLVPEPTMAQRLSRAKRKIRDAGIAYRIPDESVLQDRVAGVLATIYLIYTGGHTASTGDRLARVDLCRESVRLARLVAGLLPDEAEATGLLALLVLTESRRPARIGPDGLLVRLDLQNRSRWDRDAIGEGHRLVQDCLTRNRPGPYQLQAAIQAVHTDAPTACATDWPQVVALYDHLFTMQPTAVVALNRALAVAEVEGAAEALSQIEGLDLDEWHYWHAARAELLARMGRSVAAVAAADRALALVDNRAEERFLRQRRRHWCGEAARDD